MNFCDSIKLNSKYFRLTMNIKHRGRRFLNRNLGEDTIAIKEVNSYLNKLTDRTLSKITNEIKTRLEEEIICERWILIHCRKIIALYALYPKLFNPTRRISIAMTIGLKNLLML